MLCIGDFNDFLYEVEKEGGRAIVQSRMASFQNFLFENALLDLQSNGQQFSWSNKREGEGPMGLIRLKLD